MKDQVPADRRLLGTTWVFKVKKTEIFKARLVAQGFAQVGGIDFTDNFSPVIYKTTFRIILVLWATYNDDLEEGIKMKIPKGYSDYKGMDLNKKSCLILDHA